MPGRLLAIGDIHGCDTALGVLLDAMSITAEDTLVVLGDVVDRGPGTKQVVDRLIELRDLCQFVFIKGNHLGGNDDTQKAAREGKLEEMLA